jgi:hypothetical protein
MISGLDHVVVLVGDIEAGATAYRTLLARAPAWHSSDDGVERVLFTLDNMTLELVSPSGAGATATGSGAYSPSRAAGSRVSAFEPPTSPGCIAGSIGSR